jgi:ribose transport system ATP-binding protein
MTARAPADPALEARHVVKTFGTVRALDGASLTVRAGSIHGLIGENGAGKSTIIKVLAGICQPEAGEIRLGGRPVGRLSPALARQAGLRFVHQEVNLAPGLTVTEAVFLGQERTRCGVSLVGAMRRSAQDFLADYLGLDLDARRLVRDLGPAERKLVQIARALVDGEARLAVLDEPTAPLAATEVERVFAAVRRLRDRGIATLYVSHYLSEIHALCDQVTVLREGRDVGTLAMADQPSPDRLVELMTGGRVDQLFPPRREVPDGAPVRLAVRGLSSPGAFEDVSFEVRAGEILGLGGLLGSGRDRLVDSITGLAAAACGTVETADGRVARGSPAKAVKAGVALVPRDRRAAGLELGLPVQDNIALPVLDRLSLRGVVRRRAVTAEARRVIGELDIRPAAPDVISANLSGGNQQKVVVGRWMAAGSLVLVLEEPTVGVDIAAKAEIYRLIAELARGGAAIVVSANDTEELAGLCHRVLALRRGAVVAEVSGDALDTDGLLSLITGAVEVAA